MRVEVAGRLVGEEQRAARRTSARASATRCCSPPDSSPGRCVSRCAEADALEQLARARSARVARGTPPDERRHRHVLERGELGQQVVELEDEADRCDCGSRPAAPAPCAVTSSPSKRMLPAVGRSSVPSTCRKRRLADARGADDRDHLARRRSMRSMPRSTSMMRPPCSNDLRNRGSRRGRRAWKVAERTRSGSDGVNEWHSH